MLPHPSLVFGEDWTEPPAPSSVPAPAPAPAPAADPPVPTQQLVNFNVAPPPKRKPGRPPKPRSDLGGTSPGSFKPRSNNSAVRQAHHLRNDSELVAALRARQRTGTSRSPLSLKIAETERRLEEALCRAKQLGARATDHESKPRIQTGRQSASQPAQAIEHKVDVSTFNVKSYATQSLPSSSRKKAKKEPVDPKTIRPARHRKSCPKTIVDRQQRAMSQRMCMIERIAHRPEPNRADQFKVLGSTGNVYTVTIGSIPDCDCPDFEKGNAPCKHVIFAFLKVLKVPTYSPVWYQKGLTPAELNAVWASAPAAPSAAVSVNSRVRDAYLKATGKYPPAEEAQSSNGGKRIVATGEDCPVCYDAMTQRDEDMKKLVYDESLGGCGRPLHAECFKMWAATAKKQHKDVTCVWCRSPWPGVGGGPSNGKGKAKAGVSYSRMGYMNMASAAGISRKRDTSTYYHGGGHLYDDD
ncbi:hypothetical protein IAR50_001206 [Cryptococcus sp. DSM 104548]